MRINIWWVTFFCSSYNVPNVVTFYFMIMQWHEIHVRLKATDNIGSHLSTKKNILSVKRMHDYWNERPYNFQHFEHTEVKKSIFGKLILRKPLCGNWATRILNLKCVSTKLSLFDAPRCFWDVGGYFKWRHPVKTFDITHRHSWIL